MTISAVRDEGTPFLGALFCSVFSVVAQFSRRLPRTCRYSPYITQDNHHPTRHTFVMNQIFYVEELVRRIAFSADGGSPGSSSLLALACCCKALEGPVMDVLWQRQKHLHVILRTLPADCWTVTDEVLVSRARLDLQSHSLSLYPARNQNSYNE